MWWRGQRAARTAAADAEVQLAQASLQLARLRVASQVIDAGWACAAALAEQRLADERHRSLAALRTDVDRRVQAGDLARTDALAAEADALEAQAMVEEAVRRSELARSSWSYITGIATCPVDPHGPVPPLASETFDAASHPESVQSRLAWTVARHRLDVARSSRRDAPEVSVRYRQESTGANDVTQRGVGIGIRVPFGSDARTFPLEAAAQSEVSQAELAAERTAERLVLDERNARLELDAARLQWKTMRARAQATAERARLINNAFKAGEASLPDALRALQSASQAESQAARHASSLGLAYARHQLSLGKLP